MKQWILLAATVALAASKASAASEGSSYDPASVFDWKVRPQVGARYLMRTWTRSETNLQMPSTGQARSRAQNLVTTVTSRIVADYEVLNRDALSATTVKLTYRSFDTSVSTLTPGQSFDSSSTRSMTEAANKVMRDAFVGASLSMKIAPNGAVWSVIGLDKLRARMSRAFASMPGGGGDAFRMLSGMGFMDETSYKKTFSQSFGALPPYPVAPGDSWPYRLAVPVMGMSTELQGTRLLLSRRAGVATVKESGTINLTGALSFPGSKSASPTSVPGAKMTMNFHGAVNGATLVDEASGLPREATSNTSMSGTMTIVSTTKPPKTRPLVMHLSSRVLVRTVLEPVAAPGA